MSNNIPKSHLFTPEDLSTFEYNQIFSCCSIWFEEGMNNQIATFDLLIRDLPDCRNFFLFAGLEEVLEGIRKWSYSEEQIKFLLDYNIITPKFAEYLKDFKFTGDIWAMPEGTAFFPGEPIIRLTAPIIEANLFTMFLTNAVVSNTIFLTKAIRCVVAAATKKCIGIGGMRAHSFESSIKSTRSSYLAGVQTLASLPAAFMKYNIPMPHPLRIGFHAFIKSFKDEITAMRAIEKYFPDEMSVMVDTYELRQGIENAITVGLELQAKGKKLKGIILDSGDLFENSKIARQMLDQAGLTEVEISVASNLDEYKISDLEKRGAPIDSYMVITEGVTSADAPKLEVVYKMAQLEENGHVRQTAKFAPGKLSYPGVKQVYRIGNFEKDIIGLASEKLGHPLLIEVINNGMIKYDLPTLDEIRAYVKTQVSSLPIRLLLVETCHEYQAEVSDGLKVLLEQVREEHVKN